MTERIIQRHLKRLFGNYNYPICNAFIFGWESDFFAISKSGYCVEVEIKISRADFKKDFTKTDKHYLLANHKKNAIMEKTPWEGYTPPGATEPIMRNGASSGIYFKCPADRLPNKFYYACPQGLLAPEEIPSYAGLLYVTAGDIQEIKPAPFLHKKKNDHTKALLQKFYYKCINDRRDIYMILNTLERYSMTDDQKEAVARLEEKLYE